MLNFVDIQKLKIPLNYKFVTQPMYREINIGYILDIPITVICISPNSKENIITFGIPLLEFG